MKMETMASIIDEIIEFFGGKGRGAVARTAKKLRLSTQSISIMKRNGCVTGPAADVIEIESAGKFKAIVLREQARERKGKRVH